MGIATYPFRSSSPKLEKNEDDYDFDIVHTNWYWRNLKRRFRLTKDAILRIHPNKGDVRAYHPFTTVVAVSIIDDTSMVIHYTQSAADYVTATPEIISSITKI